MPSNQFSYSNFLGSLPPTGPTTKRISIAILVISLLGSVTERKWGFGLKDLVFSVHQVLELEWWRFITYPLVEHEPIGLIIGLLVFWLFGRIFESRWGSWDFFRFISLSWVGAALLAVPFSLLISLIMPFSDSGYAEGTGPAIDALLVYLAITSPNSNILFGFVLPMKTRTVIYVMLGFQLIVGLQTGVSSLSTTMGGMAMGYLLTTGMWRPSQLKEWYDIRQRTKRRGRIRVVPPPDDRPTLHRER